MVHEGSQARNAGLWWFQQLPLTLPPASMATTGIACPVTGPATESQEISHQREVFEPKVSLTSLAAYLHRVRGMISDVAWIQRLSSETAQTCGAASPVSLPRSPSVTASPEHCSPFPRFSSNPTWPSARERGAP